MIGNHTIEDRVCDRCSTKFTPKPGGYNARFCSPECKSLNRVRNKDIPSAKRDYQREYMRNRMKTDADFRVAHNARAIQYQKEVREWLYAYKLEHGCVDCGYKGHFSALQLDHEGEKSVEISKARTSISRLKAEIESGQCKVRCANGHSIKTWERKQKPGNPGEVGKGCDQ